MEEIKNNYVEKSRYKNGEKRKAYKKNWAREKRMKVKLQKEKTEEENTPLIKNVIIIRRKRPIVQPVVHAGENQAYF